MEPKRNPEQIIKDLGGCGAYQFGISIFGHALKILTCWTLTSMVVISKTPGDWWCDEGSDGTGSDHANATTVAYTATLGSGTRNESHLWALNTTTDPMYKSCVTSTGAACTKFRYGGRTTIVSEFDLVCDSAFAPSFAMSIQAVGMVTGTFAGGQLADLFGRKKPLFGAILIQVVANLVCYLANSWPLFVASRFMMGLSHGAFLLALYSLLSEFSLAQHRAWIIGFPSWPIEASLFAAVAWWLQDWRNVQLAVLVVGVPCLLAWCVLPESFRWYLAHDRTEDAQRVLATVAKVNRKPAIKLAQLEEMRLVTDDDAEVGMKTSSDRKYTFVDIFRNKRILKLTVLLSVIWFTNGFSTSGISFGIQKLSGNLYLNLFLFAINGVPTKIIGIFLENRIGRRGTAILMFTLVAVGGYGAGIVNYIDTSRRGALINAFALTADVGLAAAWSCAQTMTVELYPTVIRSVGFGLLSTMSRIGGIVGPQFVFLSTATPGLLFFTVGGLATCSIIVMLCLKETKGANLTDKISQLQETEAA